MRKVEDQKLEVKCYSPSDIVIGLALFGLGILTDCIKIFIMRNGEVNE